MVSGMAFCVVPQLLIVLLISTVVDGRAFCGADTFYDIRTEQCRPCSSCRVNQIIYRICQYDKDIECGPFYDFDGFKSKDLPSVVISTETTNQEHRTSRDNATWYTLTTVMLNVLCVASVILVCFLLSIYFLRRKNAKDPDYSREDSDVVLNLTEPGYENLETVVLVRDTC